MAATGRVAPDGTYDLGLVEAGAYDLVAGTDPDGRGMLGSGGSFYVDTPVVIDYDGDAAVDLTLERR